MRLTTLAVVALLALAAAPAARGAVTGPVVEWFQEAQKAVVLFNIPNQLSAKVYGLLGVSQFKALRAVRNSRTWKGKLNDTALAAYASHYVLSNLFPQRQSNVYDGLLAKHTAGLTTTELDAAENLAVNAAEDVLGPRLPDAKATRWARFKSPANGTVGEYVFTPGQTFALYPQLRNAKTLVLDSRAVARIAGKFKPNAVTSARYQSELAFVKDYGVKESTVRSQYDTDSATFWADGTNTSAIGGHWLNIAYTVLPPTFTTYSQVRFFARFGAAVYDASIVAWRIKYTTLFWRPITAIRTGDGTNAPNPTWTPLLATPPHPEFPSGHQATVGGALGALSRALGTEQVTFTIGTEWLPPAGSSLQPLAPRTYTSLRTAAVEVGDSRVFAGVHFNVSGSAGLQVGLEVATLVAKKFN